MESKQYIAEALKTESIPPDIQFGTIGLHSVLSLAIAVSDMMDQVKRGIFYGKGFDVEKFQAASIAALGPLSHVLTCADQMTNRNDMAEFLQRAQDEGSELPEGMEKTSVDNVNIRLLHAAIGLFTESGELLELIRAQMEGRGMDLVHFGEELGDVDWYKALAHDASGVSEADCRIANVKKLHDKQKGRYRQGEFNADEAAERDLTAERELLQSAIPTADVLVH